ncbi:MAG: hypothetical protein L0Y79_06645 [Chlorobi bacterium]|nr:hypothetical protein [Chlorobiota bacterium]MCI0715402.1 hypothetical protein [Chlorobiota bacterium]
MKKIKIIIVLAAFWIIALASIIGCRKEETPVEPPFTSPTQIFSMSMGTSVSDLVTGIKQADDGGIVLCGYTIASAFGDNDIFIIKLAADRSIIWSNLYGGSGNDQATYIEKTNDGGFIIGGHTTSFSGSFDPLTIKLDAGGNIQWSKYYRWWNEDYSNCVIQTGDGGYILTGYSNSFGSGGYDVYSLKIDQSGSIMWVRCYGGQFNEFGNSIRETSDGGYIIGGYTFSFGSLGDGYVLKLFGDGLINWSKTYGSTGFDNIKDLQTSLNGFIACGSTISFGLSSEDGYVFNIDNQGFVYWSRTFGGSVSGVDQLNRVIQTSDGGYVLAGMLQNTNENSSDMCLMKLYGDGAFNYAKIFGGVGADIGNALSIKSDGGYLLAGSSASFGAGANDLYIQSLKSDGTGCLTDNPVTPVGGNPIIEVNDASSVYFNVDFYETNQANLNTASFNTIQNTQCSHAP